MTFSVVNRRFQLSRNDGRPEVHFPRTCSVSSMPLDRLASFFVGWSPFQAQRSAPTVVLPTYVGPPSPKRLYGISPFRAENRAYVPPLRATPCPPDNSSSRRVTASRLLFFRSACALTVWCRNPVVKPTGHTHKLTASVRAQTWFSRNVCDCTFRHDARVHMITYLLMLVWVAISEHPRSWKWTYWTNESDYTK